jgi:hypothetical protein
VGSIRGSYAILTRRRLLDHVRDLRYLGVMPGISRDLSNFSFARLSSRLGRHGLLIAVWSIVGVAAMAQRAMERSLSGGPLDLRAVLIDLWLIAMWAFATPAILRAARRFPLCAGTVLRHGALHALFAIAFVLATNIVIRVPMLFDRPFRMGDVARDLEWGLVHFGPTALMLFGIIVAVGHLPRRVLAPAAVDAVSIATPETVPEPSVSPAAHPERIWVREWSRPRLVRASDVEWIEADDNYVIVHVAGRTYKGRGRISDLADQLDPADFVRIHRSAVVRLTSVREVRPVSKGDLAVILHDGKTLRVARSRRHLLETALGPAAGR